MNNNNSKWEAINKGKHGNQESTQNPHTWGFSSHTPNNLQIELQAHPIKSSETQESHLQESQTLNKPKDKDQTISQVIHTHTHINT